MSQEKAFFDSFVVPAKRQRYGELLDKKRGREKIRLSLDHFKDLDSRFCRKVPVGAQTPDGIFKVLKGLGAPLVCWVMSSDDKLDNREMDLQEALQEIVGRGMGTALSCIPGVLGYFESEEIGERYVCHRERKAPLDRQATRSE